MSNDTAGATKQDIQMIMDTLNVLNNKVETLDKKIEDKFEESQHYTAVLIEDLEDKLLGTNHDVISLHTDKLDDHEERVSKLETQMIYVQS